jgi:O-antigen/teichoic acid export membrane protein
MKRWFNTLVAFLLAGDHPLYKEILLRRSFKIMVIQAVGLLLSLAANILLARIYGEEVYGVYSLVTSWSILIAVVALFGMDDSHLVKLPSYKFSRLHSHLKAQFAWSFQVNFLSTFGCIFTAYALINWGHIEGLSLHAHEFNFGLAMVAILCFYNNLISFLRGIDLVVAGEIIDKIFRPTAFLLFVYLLHSLMPIIGAGGALLANNLALLIVLGTAFMLIIPYLRMPGKIQIREMNFSLRPNLRYTFLNLLYLFASRLDILLLGILASPIVVGHYNVASRFSEVFSYPIAIINLSLPTLIAKERNDKGINSSPGLMMVIARNSFFQCLLLDMVVLFAGNWFLSWYGKGFTEAFPVLLILLSSSLVSAFTGSLDVFFIMNGAEKKAIYCRIVALLFSLLLAIFLVPPLGMIGAALSMLGGNIIYSSMLEYQFFRQYGVIVHPFHFTNPEKQ